MAGTRLLIQTSFLIQIPLLVIIALLYEYLNDGFQAHLNYKLFSYRDTSFHIESLRSKIDLLTEESKNLSLSISMPLMIVLPVNSEMNSYHKNDNDLIRNISDQFKNGIMSSMKNKNHHQNIQIKIPSQQFLEHDNHLQFSQDCDNLDLSNEISFQNKYFNDVEHDYPIMVVFGCTEKSFSTNRRQGIDQKRSHSSRVNVMAKITVHESGFILVQIRGNGFEANHAVSKNDINYDLINGPVAQTISDEVLFCTSSESTLSSVSLQPSYEVTVTFLNQDPSLSPPHHLLETHFLDSIHRTLEPFLSTFKHSHLTSFSIRSTTIAYTGHHFPAITKRRFSRHSSQNMILVNNDEEKENEASIFTVLGSSLLDWFSKDILDSASTRFSNPSSFYFSNADLNNFTKLEIKDLESSQLNFVVFLPSKQNAPLYIQKYEKKGRRAGELCPLENS